MKTYVCSCGEIYRLDEKTFIGSSDMGDFYNCPFCKSTHLEPKEEGENGTI